MGTLKAGGFLDPQIKIGRSILSLHNNQTIAFDVIVFRRIAFTNGRFFGLGVFEGFQNPQSLPTRAFLNLRCRKYLWH